MKKVFNLYIGSRGDLSQIKNNEDWAIVHACKTSHKKRLGYNKPPKGKDCYFDFRDENHLYINWVDVPHPKFFKAETFTIALNFIDEYINNRKVFIHCDQGLSRSPTLGMVYLAKRTNYLEDDFQKALIEFKKNYAQYNPSGILKFVKQNWDKIK